MGIRKGNANGSGRGRADAELAKVRAEAAKLDSEARKLDAEVRRFTFNKVLDLVKVTAAVVGVGFAGAKAMDALGWL